jgi:hypothetical protein
LRRELWSSLERVGEGSEIIKLARLVYCVGGKESDE